MREREYISETHKQRHLLEKYKTKQYIFTLLAIFLWGIGFYFLFSEVLYTQEDREKLKLIKEYRMQALEKIKDPDVYTEYINYLKQEEEKIKDKYPFPALWNVGSYPGNKLLFVGFSLLPFLIATVGYIYLKKKVFPEWDKFVLPVVGQEPPMILPEKGENLWGDRYKELEKKFLTDPDVVRKLFASLKIKEMPSAEKFIAELMKECEDFLKKYFPYEKHKEVLFCIEFLLFHHFASLYGNIPTSLLGKYIKDYNLRKALSLYQRNHVPVIVSIKGKLIEREEEAFILCKIFYTCDRTLKLRERINEKFDPLAIAV